MREARAERICAQAVAMFHPIKPMLASRRAPEDVVSIMGDNPFVIETKFDGERVQVHKDGASIRLFSRNSIDTTRIYGEAMVPLLREHVRAERVILDGELLVWDSLSGHFEPFGKLKTTALYSKRAGTAGGRAAVGDQFGKQLCCENGRRFWWGRRFPPGCGAHNAMQSRVCGAHKRGSTLRSA